MKKGGGIGFFVGNGHLVRYHIRNEKCHGEGLRDEQEGDKGGLKFLLSTEETQCFRYHLFVMCSNEFFPGVFCFSRTSLPEGRHSRCLLCTH
jgi:hypothetical protein